MRWKVYILYGNLGAEYYCDTREEALMAGFIVLENLDQGLKEVRILYSDDGQSSWNLDRSFSIK